MKNTDSILRLQTELDLIGNAERQLRFARPEFERILKQRREMEALIPKYTAVFEGYSLAWASSPLFKELNLASRAIAELHLRPEFMSFQANVAGLSQVAASVGEEFARTLAPLRSVVAGIEAHFALQLDSHRNALDALRFTHQEWTHNLELAAARIVEVARSNFTIPEAAALHWPGELITSRARLLEDCVLNTAALEKFYGAATIPNARVSPDQLTAASHFVFGHAELVRRLPPRLPVSESEEDNQQHRNEEVGGKLDLALRDFDARLLELRRRAWRNLTGGSVAGARLAMAGIREIFTDILHTLAPDAEIKTTVAWEARPKDISRPTRRMRLEYILGEERACEADTLLQFGESVNRTQKFVHTFADDAELVRVQMAHLEIWIYLLLLHSKERPE